MTPTLLASADDGGAGIVLLLFLFVGLTIRELLSFSTGRAQNRRKKEERQAAQRRYEAFMEEQLGPDWREKL